MTVSRETQLRLDTLKTLTLRWNKTINLVANSTLPNIWHRHFEDSLQLWEHRPHDAASWLDLGSGGGFPGLVVAALAAQDQPELEVVLVESDKRKAAFLLLAAQEMRLRVSVEAARLETLAAVGAQVVSARALAPLPALLGFACRHLAPSGTLLALKGARYKDEIAAASRTWEFECQVIPSKTDAAAAILKIRSIKRADA